MPDLLAVPLPSADVVITRIPDTAQAWDYEAAVASGDARRFPLGPPTDSRIALIWHGLSHLGAANSRMGVLLPLTLLDSDEGLVLRRHLVQQHQLEAVIELPVGNRSHPALRLLVLRHENLHGTVAFISGTVTHEAPMPPHNSEPYDAATVLRAYRAHRSLQAAPCLHPIDYATLARHDYAFHLSAYDAWRRSDMALATAQG